MLENYLTKGSPADWLPKEEGGVLDGGGGLCSHGIKDVFVRHSMQSHNARHSKLGDLKALYLPFVPNGINYAESMGQDVISYNFTGCIMAVFDHNGSRKVCHVSTGSGQDCKAAWANIKASSKNIFEFKPSDFIEASGMVFCGCYGLITPQLDLYSITVAQSSTNERVVAAITKAHVLR